MGRDLLKQPYGRFYYLPLALAQGGHDIHVLLLNYGRENEIHVNKDGIHWTSVSLLQANPLSYLQQARRLVRKVKPDWIFGFSDTYYNILAQKLASRYGCQSLVDAYDNFESYIPWLKPLHRLWRKTLAQATLVSAAGPYLAEYLGQFRPGKLTCVVPMAVDPVGFVPLDRQQCRQRLGLPSSKKLVGYCGAIFPNRGINLLFDAYAKLRESIPEIGLVLTGRLHPRISLPPDTHWLGYVPDNQISAVINSLDSMAVINRASAFGNFSYPVKLYEAMSCRIPVVATETPATRWILRNRPECLVTAESVADLSEGIRKSLSIGRIDYGPQPNWNANAALLETALGQASADISGK